jgi:antitoxin (DNA-binding transcriptional repressor) of toxin-antitoxin stability system
MTTVTMLEAKTSLSELVSAIESGTETEIIIARNGKPAARLTAIAKSPDRKVRLGIADNVFAKVTLEEFNSTDAEIAALLTGEAG